MADKPTPSGPTAAQLALVKKYLASAGWSEADLEELFSPETGTPRKTGLSDAEAKALQDQNQPKTQQGYAAGGLIALLADEAASGRGYYDSGINDIIAGAISKGEGLNPSVKDADAYKKIYDEFVSEQIATQSALNAAALKYAPIEERKGLPGRDDRYSLFAPDAQGVSRLDEDAVNYFFPSMLKNLAAYKAKNPEKMYDLPMVDRPNAPMSTTGIKPATLIKTLEAALQSEPDAGGSVMVNGTRVNAFDVRTLLDSLSGSQKTQPKGFDIIQKGAAPGLPGLGVTEQNWADAQRYFGPTGTTPDAKRYKKALDTYNKQIATYTSDDSMEQSAVDKKVRDLDASNFAAMKAILDANTAPWVKGAVGAPVTSVPQKMLTQKGGQGQANINPTFQWQNALAIQEAKKRLDASGRTPFMDVLFNMAQSGALNKSTK